MAMAAVSGHWMASTTATSGMSGSRASGYPA
jgi:hypothetical protein